MAKAQSTEWVLLGWKAKVPCEIARFTRWADADAERPAHKTVFDATSIEVAREWDMACRSKKDPT